MNILSTFRVETLTRGVEECYSRSFLRRTNIGGFDPGPSAHFGIPRHLFAILIDPRNVLRLRRCLRGRKNRALLRRWKIRPARHPALIAALTRRNDHRLITARCRPKAAEHARLFAIARTAQTRPASARVAAGEKQDGTDGEQTADWFPEHGKLFLLGALTRGVFQQRLPFRLLRLDDNAILRRKSKRANRDMTRNEIYPEI